MHAGEGRTKRKRRSEREREKSRGGACISWLEKEQGEEGRKQQWLKTDANTERGREMEKEEQNREFGGIVEGIANIMKRDAKMVLSKIRNFKHNKKKTQRGKKNKNICPYAPAN